jgi:hypothetical protein
MDIEPAILSLEKRMIRKMIFSMTLGVLIVRSQTVMIAPHLDAARPLNDNPQLHSISATQAVLGFTTNAEGTGLRPIFGTPDSPRLGTDVSLPEGVQRFHLPPGQHYALLVEFGQPVGILGLHAKSAGTVSTIAIPGSIANPDLVSFSPRGRSAVLYSGSNDAIQVLSPLPNQPATSNLPSLASWGAVSRVAVTDDGKVVVAALSSGLIVCSRNGGEWQKLALAYIPSAWVFLPGTHDFVIGDVQRQVIARINSIGSEPVSADIVNSNIATERLAVTKDGRRLVATNRSAEIVVIDLQTKDARVALRPSRIDSLLPLRNGQTFLLSTSPTQVLELTDTPGIAESPAATARSLQPGSPTE